MHFYLNLSSTIKLPHEKRTMKKKCYRLIISLKQCLIFSKDQKDLFLANIEAHII